MRAMKRFVITVAMVSMVLAGFAGEAEAQKPRPTGDTPSLNGAQVIPRGSTALGITVGYPSLRLHAVWGVGRNFDVGLMPALTYGTRLDGYRQRLGLNLQIPLRWALADKPNFNFGFRLMPYFRIGEGSPAFSVGGNVGFRFGIAMPRVFTLIFGPEGRIGFASVGDTTPGRANGLDAELTGMVGLESYLKRKWLLSLEMHFGHLFGAGGLPGGEFIYRTWFGFAYVFR
jgi:hypothetical protein